MNRRRSFAALSRALVIALALTPVSPAPSAARPAEADQAGGVVITQSGGSPNRPAALTAPATDVCYAEYTGDNTTDFSSADASAVQQAVDAAGAGGTVKVAGYCAGVQALAGTTQTVYISQTLTLMGGFTTTDWMTSDPLANPTTLDALAQGRVIYATAAVTVSDLTVQYGNVNGSGGGALFESSTTLIDTQFLTNTATNGGGAFFVGTATLAGSQFSGNNVSVSGGGAFFNSTATLTGTAFSGNIATFLGGGAAFNNIATLTNTQFSNNTTVSNGGGAAFASNATVIDSLFQNNLSAGSSIGNGGGGVWAGARLMITDTQFINNRARSSGIGIGGGLYLNGSDVHIVNTLFARNSAASGAAAYVNNGGRTVNVIHTTVAGPTLSGGSAFYVAAGTVNLTNTIIASHTLGIQRVGGAANENYTLFSGVTTPRSGTVNVGGNSITGTAGFANPTADNYQLTAASSAFEAGTNAGVTTDYYGNARPLGEGFDIGFHELPPPHFCLATPDNGTTVFSSTRFIAVQQAVDAAAPNGTVKVAGTCIGVQARGGTTQTVMITKALTLAGGFTTTNWTTSDPTANPTTLDALGSGRVISATAAVTLSNLTVQRGNTSSDGGGAWFGSAASLIGTQFFNNNANTNGGGAYFRGAAQVTGTVFVTNNANSSGGGTFFNSTATVSSTQFINNNAHSNGGGTFFNITATVSSTQFINNNANTYGGGAYFVSSATLAGNLFQGNRGSRGGGAYFVGAATLAGGLFQDNRVTNAGSQGGGAYFGSTAALTDTQFFSNSAFNGGGAAFYGPATLTGTQFISNTATTFYGGGAYFQGNAAVTGAQFISNTAALDGGGATFFFPATLADTRFLSNTAIGKGGGAYFQNDATLAGGLFQNNRSTNTAGGGAYFATTFYTIMLTGTQFFGNTASASGGGLVANSGLILTDTEFIGNTAGTWGGGLYQWASSSPSRIVNSVFARNLASSGDAMYLADPSSYGGTIEVIHTTIASTTMSAGSAIVVGNGSVNLTNTLIASHTVGIQRAGGTVKENFTLFSGVTAPTSGTVTSGGNSLTGTAGFVDPENGDYRLTSASSAVDAGTNAGVTTDFLGNPRPEGAEFDIGFHEFIPPDACFATPDNGTTVFSSTRFIAVQQAVDAAAPNGTVKVAGYCAGVQALAGTTQTVVITKALTLAGGFTTTNWTTSDPTAYPTTLDARSKGRVISATAAVTLSNLTVQRGNTSSDGGGAWFGSAATLTGTQFYSNAAGASGGGAYFDAGGVGSGLTFISNTAANGSALYQQAGGSDFAGSCIVGNNNTAVQFNSGMPISATGSWWGHPSGPSGAGPGVGDSVSANVDFSGFLAAPILGCPAFGDPDLAIVKTVTPTFVVRGGAITYVLSFSNTGQHFARGITITDSVPVSVAITSVTSHTFAGGVFITQTSGSPEFAWAVGELAAGAGGVITLTGTVNNGTALIGTTITNTAVITTGYDATGANNSSSVSSLVLKPLTVVYVPHTRRDGPAEW